MVLIKCKSCGCFYSFKLTQKKLPLRFLQCSNCENLLPLEGVLNYEEVLSRISNSNFSFQIIPNADAVKIEYRL